MGKKRRARGWENLGRFYRVPSPSRKDSSVCTNLPTPLNQLGASILTHPTEGPKKQTSWLCYAKLAFRPHLSYYSLYFYRDSNPFGVDEGVHRLHHRLLDDLQNLRPVGLVALDQELVVDRRHDERRAVELPQSLMDFGHGHLQAVGRRSPARGR